jgi:hypothetical protein
MPPKATDVPAARSSISLASISLDHTILRRSIARRLVTIPRHSTPSARRSPRGKATPLRQRSSLSSVCTSPGSRPASIAFWIISSAAVRASR